MIYGIQPRPHIFVFDPVLDRLNVHVVYCNYLIICRKYYIVKSFKIIMAKTMAYLRINGDNKNEMYKMRQ